jgi:ligand-binding sensor domain-containing protein/two-component sensor histidine kinase
MHRMLKGCFHGMLLTLVFCLTSRSQQIIFKNYSFAQGLNTYNIFRTLQDDYGFIWVSTQDGVFRFNGKQFTVFKKNSSSENSLEGISFFDMAPGKDTSLYFAGFKSGIEKMNILNLRVDKVPSRLPDLWLKRMFIDSMGGTWVGGKDFLAHRNNDSVFNVIKTIEGFNGPLDIRFIRPLDDKRVAVGIEGFGAAVFDSRTMKKIFSISGNSLSCGGKICEVRDIITDADTTYAITTEGIVKGYITSNQFQPVVFYPFPRFKNLIINSVVMDKEKRFWIGTSTGLVRFDLQTNQAEIYQVNRVKKRWLLDNYINHLMIDRQNNLWISTSKSLQMVSLEPSPFRYFSGDLEGSDPMDHVYSLVDSRDSGLYATATDGLYKTDFTNGSTKRIKGSESLGVVHHIEYTEPDFWIITCDEGMFAYVPSRNIISKAVLLEKFPEWKPFAENYFNNVFHIGESSYWASEENEGLIKWDKKNKIITQFKKGLPNDGGLPENHIHNVKADRKGHLWLLMDNSVALFDVKTDKVTKIISYQPDGKAGKGFNSRVFFDMFDDGKILWFASFGGGLNGYNPSTEEWTYITEREGLCNNSVYGILPEKDSIFWVSTNSGLSRVNYYTKNCTNYFFEDGLQDNSFDEKGALQLKEKLYFGGINGFTEIDWRKNEVSILPFPVYIHQVDYYKGSEVIKLNNLQWTNLSFPSGTNIINVHLSALTYANNQKIKFSYNIVGVQDGFIDVPDDNIITLNNLAYGTYRVKIRYRREDGSFGTSPLIFDFYIVPKWYQNWWFKAIVVLFIGGLLYSFYIYRITQIRKQEQIRKDIAGDLHDDIGSTLNSIKVFSNLSLSKPDKTEYLLQIKEETQNAIAGVRDMMWVLNDNLDAIDDMVTRFEQFALNLAEARQIKIEKFVSPEIRNLVLKKDEKRNIYLILKEAFNNCVKYADSKTFGYSIKYERSKKICIKIWDDGKGFDMAQPGAGYGLKNMKDRAGQIGYSIKIYSQPGQGTSIELYKN